MNESLKSKRTHKDACERKQDILLAATKVFSEFGMQAADMQTIADLSGVGKGTVYRYFENKEQLFRLSIELHLERLKCVIDQATSDVVKPLEKLRAAWTAYLEFFQANPNLIELFRQESACGHGQQAQSSSYMEWINERRGYWRSIIEQILNSSPSPVFSADQLLVMSEQLIHGAVILNTKNMVQYPVREQVNLMMQIFQHGFMHDS